MADEPQDNCATIIDNSNGISSQEVLLSHAQFAREDETFPEDEEAQSTEVDGFGEYCRKLDGVELERSCGGEFAAGGADNAEGENVGFRRERKRAIEGESSGTKLEGKCGAERGIETQLKSSRVSPLLHCSGKVEIVTEEEDDEEKVVAFSGDLKVDVASSSPSVVVPEGVGYTDQSDSEGSDDSDDNVGVEDEVSRESRVKRKLEFFTDTEDHGEDSGNEEKEDCVSWREEKAMDSTSFKDYSKITPIEIAKQLGVTFPRSRFLRGTEEDEYI